MKTKSLPLDIHDKGYSSIMHQVIDDCEKERQVQLDSTKAKYVLSRILMLEWDFSLNDLQNTMVKTMVNTSKLMVKETSEQERYLHSRAISEMEGIYDLFNTVINYGVADYEVPQ